MSALVDYVGACIVNVAKAPTRKLLDAAWNLPLCGKAGKLKRMLTVNAVCLAAIN